MQMTATTWRQGIKREVGCRVAIAIFWCLCLLLSYTILKPIQNGTLYLVVTALIELFTIQAMRGLFGDAPLIRDANELNFYGFLIHLGAIPLYLNGVDSSYHNNAINAMIALYLLRLCYFGAKRPDGEYGGWAKFGALGCIYQLISKYGNNPLGQQLVFIGKTIIVLGTIIPLWLITIQTNDQNTSLFTILATSFILIYGYWKNAVASRSRDVAATLLNDETIPLCKAYNKRSSDARMIIRQVVLQDFSVQDMDSYVQQTTAKAERARKRAIAARARIIRRLVKIKRKAEFEYPFARLVVYGCLVCLAMFFAANYGVLKQTRLVSYATGYIDAKTGKQPKTETNINQMMDCIAMQNRSRPIPPSPICEQYLKFKE